MVVLPSVSNDEDDDVEEDVDVEVEEESSFKVAGMRPRLLCRIILQETLVATMGLLRSDMTWLLWEPNSNGSTMSTVPLVSSASAPIFSSEQSSPRMEMTSITVPFALAI